MKTERLIKKSLAAVLLISILLAFSACAEQTDAYPKTVNKDSVRLAGVEYKYLCQEPELCYFGGLVFQGGVKGEPKTLLHLDLAYQTGLFSIKNDESKSILIRHFPDNEWYGIYRKASLTPFDFSVDNCIRFELVLEPSGIERDAIHTTCGDGISDKTEIAEFLSDVRSQMDAEEAGLYDSVKQPDGSLKNCYVYATIYGFFKEEPNLAIPMEVLSFNDQAYSVSLDGKEYVLPAIWLEKLQNK